MRIQPFIAAAETIRCAAVNRFSRRRVIAHGDGPVVSLTSYGRRLNHVHLTIESIATGRTLPSRLILWIDRGAIVGPALRRLVHRGLEIYETEASWGPHKKYYPYVSGAHFDPSRRLVTADDDTFYPRRWLADLVNAARREPAAVWAHRTRTMLVAKDGAAPYGDWPFTSRAGVSPVHVANGVGGVSYPPELLAMLRDAGTAFMDVAPRADDLWLHVHAVRAGFPVGQVADRAPTFPDQIFSQGAGALWSSNLVHGGNDPVVAALYSDRDLALLRQAVPV